MVISDLNQFITMLPKLIRENDAVKGSIITALAGVMTTRDDITALIAEMDKRFMTMQEQLDKRFETLQEQLDKRFGAWQVQLDKRFEIAENLLFRIAQDQVGMLFVVSEIKKICDQMQQL
nr:hypothetical protein [Candidatus Sigynarchaeum springense]MDO8118788.1 hypothetical protein [Candidatus Sigynarchaeota archaeon]